MNMFDWVGGFFKGIVTVVASGLALIGIGTAHVEPPATSTPSVAQEEQAATTTSEIDQLRQELEKEKAARVQSDTERLNAEKATAEAEAARLQAEVDSLKKESSVTTQTQTTPQGTYCNGKYWATCPTGQIFTCPTTGNAYCANPTSNASTYQGKDYRFEMISRLNSLIAVEKSFVDWLEDTSDQFRDVSTTLSSYPFAGGLVGEARALSIEIANKEVQVISSLISNSNKTISGYESSLNLINSKPNELIDEKTLNLLPTISSVENDIKSVKNSLSETLSEVMVALQYY